MIRTIARVALGSILLLPTACGAHSHKKRYDKPQKITEYFTHGRPEKLIEGATLDKHSFLNVDNLEKFQGFHLSTGSSFSERSPKYNPKDWRELESTNATTETEEEIRDEFALETWSFVRVDDRHYAFKEDRQRKPDEAAPMVLNFTVSDRDLVLEDVNGIKVDVQHYSLKADGRAFSFLFAYESPQKGRTLVSLAFAASDHPEAMPAPLKDYAFLNGNLPIGWKEPIKIDACGNFDDSERSLIKGSVTAWFDDPTDEAVGERLPVAFAFKTAYAPFSDLNEHCLMLIRNFKMENSDNFYTGGVAMSNIDKAAKKIIDNDIFIFMDHVAEEPSYTRQAIIMHEIGHFFGLGHEFARNEQGAALHESVMAYEKGTKTITFRDFEAIRALYGKALGPATP